MADAGVGADDEVEAVHDGGGIEEGAAGSVEVVAERVDFEVGEVRQLLAAVALLKADERDAGHFGEGCKGREGEAAAVIADGGCAPLPGDADFEAFDGERKRAGLAIFRCGRDRLSNRGSEPGSRWDRAA